MQSRIIKSATMMVGGLLLAAAPGCNMDGTFEDNRPPKGPIANAKDPARTGLPPGVSLEVVERQEVDLVEDVLTHRAQYLQGLEGLRDYYSAHGYAAKQAWADFELKGLRKVKQFRYLLDAEIPSDQLRPTGIVPEADAVVERQEVDLVENVLAHRAQYHQGLEELRDYYRDHGYATKLSWADFELAGLRKVKAFRYLIDAEIASDQLRPTDIVPEADALYERGQKLLRKGGHGVPIFYRQKTMIQAAEVFQQLVEQYPNSDKIDDAAFFLGEIHKEYLPDQEPIAVKWYERAWTWDPETPHPARFQAAVIYDYRLHDRDRALELYQSVIKNETGDWTNVNFATRRIRELTTARRTATAQVTTSE